MQIYAYIWWCCFEPETSGIDCMWHRLHIAHVQMQFHPRWNLTAANTPNTLWIKTRTDTSCMRLWLHRPTAVGAFQDYLKNIYFRGRGGAGLFFLHWKHKWVSCYLRSIAWTLPWSHCTTFAHHVITLKDSHVALITINPPQNEMSGVRLYNQWLHSRDSNYLPSSIWVPNW